MKNKSAPTPQKSPSKQMSFLLPVSGTLAKPTSGVVYRSAEFYEIRDRLVNSLPSGKKDKG